MSLTVVGSVGLDTVETPQGRNEEGLGGSATYFALAAAQYCPVNLIGIVGEDFPDTHVQLLEDAGVNLEGLERVPGRTFRWAGRYHDDVNKRDTLDTQLNVFEQFHPKLPETARQARYLFLGNIHPSLQLEVFDQTDAEFVALDTMNLWIDIALDDLKAVLKRVHAIIINDSEAKMLTGEQNLIRAAEAVGTLGPRIVVVKKGEHGCLLLSGDEAFSAPAFPLKDVADPTGAGDTFAGGFLGYITAHGATDDATLRRAVVHGSVLASFTCEKFGPDRLTEITEQDIASRYKAFHDLAAF